MTNEERKVIELALDWIQKQPGETPDSKYDVDTRYVVLRELEAALAQPKQKPVAWKLVPIEPTREMLEAMDECSIEGYDEHLYAGHAASVYMAAVDVAPTPPEPEKPDQDEVDIRSRLYQRIHELETQLAQPEQEQIAAWLEKECDEQYLADRVRAGDYAKEKGHTENCAALADDIGKRHLSRSIVGVGDKDYTAQAKQEPVALQDDEIYDAAFSAYCRGENTKELFRIMWNSQLTCSIGWDRDELKSFARNIAALYTTPPQRKPLTRGQIREIEVDVSLNQSFDYITPAEQLCRAIEAAHGIKE